MLFVLMRGINTHYKKVDAEIAVEPEERNLLPSRVRAVIVVIGIIVGLLPALRAKRLKIVDALAGR